MMATSHEDCQPQKKRMSYKIESGPGSLLVDV
jgi:hypothetical protein